MAIDTAKAAVDPFRYELYEGTRKRAEKVEESWEETLDDD